MSSGAAAARGSSSGRYTSAASDGYGAADRDAWRSPHGEAEYEAAAHVAAGDVAQRVASGSSVGGGYEDGAGYAARAGGTGSSDAAAHLEDIFYAYCNFGSAGGGREMDNAKFAKLCRESGLQDGRIVSPASVDITFSRVKPPGRRTIGFEDFIIAISELAHAKYPAASREEAFTAACGVIIEAGGPALVRTAVPSAGGVCECGCACTASRCICAEAMHGGRACRVGYPTHPHSLTPHPTLPPSCRLKALQHVLVHGHTQASLRPRVWRRPRPRGP